MLHHHHHNTVINLHPRSLTPTKLGMTSASKPRCPNALDNLTKSLKYKIQIVSFCTFQKRKNMLLL